MKILDRLAKNLPDYVDRYCKRIATSIEDKASHNLDKVIPYLSDIQDFPFIYTIKGGTKEDIIYTVNVSGKQVAFLEFGTGITTDRYPWGLAINEYTPSILHQIPARGSYGKHKGNQTRWTFYPQYSGNASSLNGDHYITYRTYTRKNGDITIEFLNKPVIITKGLPPTRFLYNAVKDTIKGVRPKKII